jgi:NhaA family Na+:H+ antiporter
MDHRALPRSIARPVLKYLGLETAGAGVLLCATAIALIWANSPWSGSYASLWQTKISLVVGDLALSEDLRHWVNDGLMALFFFVVGLEIKRELTGGELGSVSKASLPAIAALGGMVAPALIFLAFNFGGGGARGWGIPMATDIAFAIGVLALLGPRCPQGLKVFLLALAIVDDIGAIIVIAAFYSTGVSALWLGAAAAGLALMVALRRLQVRWTPIYVVAGVAVWLATLESGVHATIAGVAIGLLTPARPDDPEGARDAIREGEILQGDPTPAAIRATTFQTRQLISPAERLEHVLHPWTSFAVIPIFALAGVALGGDDLANALRSPITIGVVAGLVVGKIAGISIFSLFAVRMNLGTLPEGVRAPQLAGAGAVAGIGFTVSLFIADLAFEDGGAAQEAKVGILLGSLIAAIVGICLLRLAASPRGYGRE